MAENSLLKYMFRDGEEIDPDQKFGLSRKARMRRLREIIGLMRKHHVHEGLSPSQLRSFLVDLGPSFIKIGRCFRCDQKFYLQLIVTRLRIFKWIATQCRLKIRLPR